MAQEINLMDVGLLPHPEPLRSGQAISLCIGALSACLVLGWGLQYSTEQQTAQATALEQQVAAQNVRVANAKAALAVVGESAELRQWRAVEAEQRHLRLALDSHVAGQQQGYASYLLALARQSQANLWITGFKVAADGDGLELAGRMTDPRALPEYLRRLNTEPLFKGREFAQIVLKPVEPAVAPGVSEHTVPRVMEFALRAKATSVQAAS